MLIAIKVAPGCLTCNHFTTEYYLHCNYVWVSVFKTGKNRNTHMCTYEVKM